MSDEYQRLWDRFTQARDDVDGLRDENAKLRAVAEAASELVPHLPHCRMDDCHAPQMQDHLGYERLCDKHANELGHGYSREFEDLSHAPALRKLMAALAALTKEAK